MRLMFGGIGLSLINVGVGNHGWHDSIQIGTFGNKLTNQVVLRLSLFIQGRAEIV